MSASDPIVIRVMIYDTPINAMVLLFFATYAVISLVRLIIEVFTP